MVKEYIPKQKDIIYLDFNPQDGHEQKGIRPGLVLSSYEFNKFTKLAIVCTITNNLKEFPLHIKLNNTKTTGVVMCEQIKSIDFIARKATFKEKIDFETYEKIIEVINSFFEF